MNLLNYLKNFFEPTVDTLISHFLTTVTRLEDLAKIHLAKSAEHQSQAVGLLALSEQFASEADRAAKIALNIRRITDVDNVTSQKQSN